MRAQMRGTTGFLLMPQFAMLALACAVEPLRIANRYLAEPYRWQLLSLDGAPVCDGNGVALPVHASLAGAGGLSSLIVCADARPEQHYDAALRRQLRALDARGVTIGALDTGCFVLARAGLLDDCRATTHWEISDTFGERFPQVALQRTLFEVSDRRMTCAGGVAAIDMMLAMIAGDHGDALAARVAAHCLYDRMRSGGAAQTTSLHTLAGRERIERPELARAVRLLESALDRPVPVGELAGAVQCSPRQLLRLFKDHLGETPARFHRRIRLEHARTLLHNTAISVTDASVASGFESAAHFGRAYRAMFGCTPGSDRPHSGRDRPRVPLLRDRLAR